ncbi:BTB/POZ domain-containing protein At5g03250-like isoform X2 [Salvia miltiorrhiza]|uniref:BTB/POZ domain-containing protein At5g03250-like isoform X2 n=1 Tax=Salvia miltiorrhiza TaxID=226208 RepID=UPI0025AD2ED9|nr:BTB/POZ domain-containing protein At5g03250-like isoform X2 [Salvia miltiorrhiza]
MCFSWRAKVAVETALFRLCTTGLPSDVRVEAGEMSFHLHKFPLLSRSRLLERMIQDKDDQAKSVLSLHDLPGGAGSFLLVAKFCYDVKFELTSTNVVSLRCAAEHLQMTEDYGEGNLISQTATFLEQVLNTWEGTVQALETCEAVLPFSEELDIISRCIDSLADKACEERGWPQRYHHSPVWNGIHSSSEPCSPAGDWWYEDVAVLNLPLFKRLIDVVTCKGMAPSRIGGALMLYAKRHLPLHGRSRSGSFQERTHESDEEQRTLVEEITELLPNQKGATPTRFLLELLKVAMILDAGAACRETLERRVGAQLDQAVLQDLLIPNTVPLEETLYDVECVQRIVDYFLDMVGDDEYEGEEEQSVEGFDSPPLMTIVANLLDGYLAEIANDVNLKLEDFVLLAASLPDYARSLDDGIYRAIDIYLKAHPWLTEQERELVCRLMNCQKLSIEASTSAAQNEMLPLRVTMQVLFFEQLRLRSYMAGWFVVSDTLGGGSNERPSAVSSVAGGGGDQSITLNEVRERVSRLENKCDSIKHEIRKLVRTKGRWVNFYKRFGLKVRTKSFDLKSDAKSPTNQD